MTKYLFAIFLGAVPLVAFGQGAEPCYVELAQKLRAEDITGANRIVSSGSCDFGFKDEFGEEKKTDRKSVETLIMAVRNYRDKCDPLRQKPTATDEEIKSSSWLCGSGAGSISLLEDSEKATGVPLSDLAKTWDKFLTDHKAAMAKKEDEQKAANAKMLADQRAEAESPEAIRKLACIDDAEIKMARRMIAEEKAAAQESGFVDKAKMYRLGQTITADSRQLPALKKKYREKSGHDWSPSICKGE